MSAVAPTRTTRAFRSFQRTHAGIAHALARQIDTGSFSIVGFDGAVTNYFIDIVDVSFDGATVTVSGNARRDADSAIATDSTVTLYVGGVAVDSDGLTPFRGDGTPYNLSGVAQAGDQIRVELATDQHGGHSASATAIVPQAPGGGGGGGTDGGGGGIDVGGGDGGLAAPGEIVVEDVTVTPSAPVVGQTVTITVTARNVGDQATVRGFNVNTGATPLGSVEFVLEGGSDNERNLTWTPTSTGSTPISVGPVTQTVAVAEPTGGGDGGGTGGGGGGIGVGGGGGNGTEGGDGNGDIPTTPGDDGNGTGTLAIGGAAAAVLLALAFGV